MSQFGWIPPDDDKRAQNERYLLRGVYPQAPAVVERVFEYPPYITQYDQGPIGACVGYSCSWMMSIYNQPDCYNAYWLYKRAQKIDGDPGTSGDNDGAYVWAAGDVLRKEGHAIIKTTTPVKDYGIQSYYWCRTVDDIRTAIFEGRPPVFGIYWYSNFNTPKVKNNEYWIGEAALWGSILGGHAICCIGASDQRQAFKLLNTWGKQYPPVWISYKSITKLLGQNGECMVGLDIAPTPPPPPPDDEKIAVTVTLDGKSYAGSLERVK